MGHRGRQISISDGKVGLQKEKKVVWFQDFHTTVGKR